MRKVRRISLGNRTFRDYSDRGEWREIRFVEGHPTCPKCGSVMMFMGKDSRSRWECPNERCEVVYLRIYDYGKKARRVLAFHEKLDGVFRCRVELVCESRPLIMAGGGDGYDF